MSMRASFAPQCGKSKVDDNENCTSSLNGSEEDLARNIREEGSDEGARGESSTGAEEALKGEASSSLSSLEATSRSEEVSEGEEAPGVDTEEHESNKDRSYDILRKELADMPFDELQQLKERVGTKLYNEVMFGKCIQSNGKSRKKQLKRENKNRPMEISSKMKPKKRQVVSIKRNLVRDPRFDDLSGEFREDIYRSSYSFLGEVKKKEKQKVLKTISKEKNDEKREQLDYLYHRMTAHEKAERNRNQQQDQDRLRKKQERSLVLKGKTPYYLKNSEKKKLVLADKYRKLVKSGKVDAYLSKKRKKNAEKERCHLPT